MLSRYACFQWNQLSFFLSCRCCVFSILPAFSLFLTWCSSLWRRRCSLFYQILDCTVSKMNGHKGIVPAGDQTQWYSLLWFWCLLPGATFTCHFQCTGNWEDKNESHRVECEGCVDFAKVTALIRSVLKSIQARLQCKKNTDCPVIGNRCNSVF